MQKNDPLNQLDGGGIYIKFVFKIYRMYNYKTNLNKITNCKYAGRVNY